MERSGAAFEAARDAAGANAADEAERSFACEGAALRQEVDNMRREFEDALREERSSTIRTAEKLAAAQRSSAMLQARFHQ